MFKKFIFSEDNDNYFAHGRKVAEVGSDINVKLI